MGRDHFGGAEPPSNHLNQTAAFRSFLRSQGISITLYGPVFASYPNQHQRFHQFLEQGLWAQYRAGGSQRYQKPTVQQYNEAVAEALLYTGMPTARRDMAMRFMRAEQWEYGLTPSSRVQVPESMNLPTMR